MTVWATTAAWPTTGPSTAAELAERTSTDQHYAREWLNAQAAGSFVDYDPSTGRYELPAEHAVALTDETSPAFVGGLFQIAHGTVRDSDRILDAARTGDGVGWGDHNSDVHVGCERFFAPTYNAHLVADWLPALDGVVAKLTKRGLGGRRRMWPRRVDNPDGQSLSGLAVPRHGLPLGSDRDRRARADRSGSTSHIDFETADADAFTGGPYDLVTTFDCLHDMGDPVGAARHVRDVIADDGTWMIVEPIAGDHVEDNLNPVGRTYYGFSTLLCTPSSLSQPVGLALGTQAGPGTHP